MDPAVILRILVAAIAGGLLLVYYPGQTLKVAGVLIVAVVVSVIAGRVLYNLLRPAGQHIVRKMSLKQWSDMPAKDICPDCGGLGVVDKKRHKYPAGGATLAHVIFAAANSHGCRRCRSTGFITPVVMPAPEDITPGGSA